VPASVLSGTCFIVGDRGFTREAIASNKGELLNGRNIHDKAVEAMKNYKFAMKYHKEYCINDGKLPSGKRFEDLVLYVRQKMFVHLNGAKNNKSNARPKKDKEGHAIVLSEDEMPEKWMFHGYFAFVLFCPHGLSGIQLSCLSEDGTDVPKQSRAETRAKEAQVKMAERRASDDGTRGISTQDHVALETLANASFREESKNIRDLIHYVTVEEGNSLKSLESIYNMIDKADDENELKFLQERKRDVMNRMKELTARKRKLEAESDVLREEVKEKKKTKKLMSFPSFPKQVSVSLEMTQASSVSASGGSSKISTATKTGTTRSDALTVEGCDDSEDDDQDDEQQVMATTNNNALSFESPLLTNRPAPMSKTERELPPDARAVLEQYRAKNKGGSFQDYSLDYPY
jgi:hypothetical protein